MSDRSLPPGAVWVVTEVISTSCSQGRTFDGSELGPMVHVTVVGGPNADVPISEYQFHVMELSMLEPVARQLRWALDHDGCAHG